MLKQVENNTRLDLLLFFLVFDAVAKIFRSRDGGED